MSCPTTNAATGVTAAVATLNGDASDCGGLDSGFQWREQGDSTWEEEFCGWDLGIPYSIQIENLSEDTTYEFRATYNNYTVYGSTLTFTTESSTEEYEQSVAGALTPSGNVVGDYVHPTQEYYSYPSGAMTPSGSVAGEKLGTTTESGVAGGMTPAGVATGTKTTTTEESSVAGGMTPSGVATGTKLTVESEEDAAGAIEPTGAVTLEHFLAYRGDANVGLAAKLDLVIEQGATFTRAFHWTDDDGASIDLSPYELHMTIRAHRGSSEEILSDDDDKIILTKSETTGYFEVRIDPEETEDLDFFRAVYDIEAHDGRLVYRLVEGNMVLAREATVDA